MRLLVTGGGGFVAGSILWQAPRDWSVFAQSRGPALLDREGLTWRQADLGSGPEVKALFETAKPDAVIHTAALANIDYCQAHQEEAAAVNVEATRRVAEACAECGAKMVYCSTDNVFDGTRSMYKEDDETHPVNFYGETKVRAEQAVAAALDNHVIGRVAIVTGLHVVGAGNSFLSKMMASFQAGEAVGVPDNEVRTTIDVITLGRALLELAENDFRGKLQLAGNDRMNRYEMVRRIAIRLGHDPALVTVKNPEDIPDRAPRPYDISLDNALARQALRTPMLGLDDAITLIMENRP